MRAIDATEALLRASSALVTQPAGPVEPAPEAHVVLERLGLRLEPAQAPREYVQIDSVQRPSAN